MGTSNLKEKMAQRFFNLILLPRIRDDIDTYHRLNFHLYQALRKALFKPGAFFKGFLLPLCESGTCTLREAIIVGSVLAKNSIPVLHSCAAMLKIAEMEYSGANSIFIRFPSTCHATSSASRYNEISGNLVLEYFSASAKSLLALHS